MRRHLTSRHPSIVFEGPSQATITRAKVMKQAPLNFGQKPFTTTKQESITHKNAMKCAIYLKPTSIVEGAGFKMLVHSLNPSYRKTVFKYLQIIYEESKQALIESVQDMSISMTSDLWTSV